MDFVLLTANEEVISAGQLKTRILAQQVAGESLRVALDKPGQRHLLIPTAGRKVTPDHGAVGVSIASHPLLVDGAVVEFVDLHCHLPHLNGVFEHFAEAVVQRLSEDSGDPPAVCRAVLAEWRELLKGAVRPLGRETVEGLVGELTVLEMILGDSPHTAVAAWVGPSGALHDFAAGSLRLEVKATAALDGKSVAVSNLDQLDPAGHPLELAVVHLTDNPDASGLDMLVDRLVGLGVPRQVLVARLHEAGYIVGSGADRDFRFEVKSVRLWVVGTDFPGLRRSRVPGEHLKGVGRVRYELNLDTAPEAIPADRVEARLRNWLSLGGVTR